MEVHSRALRAEVGQGLAPGVAFASILEKGPTGRQFGSRVVQVWPKDRSKGSLLEKRGTWPKPCYLLCFRTVLVTLAGIGQLEGAPRGFIGGKGPPCAGMGAQGFNWDLWKRSETDGNGWKRMRLDANFLKPGPDQRSKSI